MTPSDNGRLRIPPPPASAASVASRARLRWRASVIVGASLLTIMMLPAMVDPKQRLPLNATLYAVQLVAGITVSNLVLDWAERGHRHLARWLPVCMAWTNAMAIAALFLLRHGGRLGIGTFDPDAPDSVCIVVGVILGSIDFGAWALGCVLPVATAEARTRQLEAEAYRLEAEKLKVSAELALLRSQFEPHFLLNSLNTIAGLVTKRPREARRLLGCLGDLLRESLHDPVETHTVEREVTWLRRYAEILETRHEGVLHFEWRVDAEVESVVLPRLLLQPLVENAVNHGVLPREGGGTVRISVTSARTAGLPAVLLCVVEDDGVGLRGEPRPGAFGIRSTRRRLELEYGPRADLELTSTEQGTRAVVRIPLDEGSPVTPTGE